MSPDRAFLDTNVLVYAVDHDNRAKAECAREILATDEPGQLAISAQVLGEFYVVATGKLQRPLDPVLAEHAVEWLAFLDVVALDATSVRAAIRLARSSQLSYWDALIVTAAAAGRCERILTEDLNHGQVIAGVRVENPFRDLPR